MNFLHLQFFSVWLNFLTQHSHSIYWVTRQTHSRFILLFHTHTKEHFKDGIQEAIIKYLDLGLVHDRAIQKTSSFAQILLSYLPTCRPAYLPTYHLSVNVISPSCLECLLYANFHFGPSKSLSLS